MSDKIIPPESLDPESTTGAQREQPEIDAPHNAADDAGPVTDGGAAEPELLPYPIVVVGGSAGGLEPCRELLRGFPPDSGAALVIATHMAPDQKSHLVEILARETSLPVIAAEDGVRPEPNHIYVMPPNVYMSMARGRLRLEPRPAGVRVPMPIDYLFRSLAADQKNRVIGVILSGADSDGAQGLKAIKGEGGIAIVQAPETASHPGMPRKSIAADHVDMVLPPQEIGVELGRLGRRFAKPDVRRLEEAPAQPPGEDQSFVRVLNLLMPVAGIDFRQYKTATLRRRIARRMMLSRVAGLEEYVSVLQRQPTELRELHEDVLINVTRFFRDPDVFETLKSHILPMLIDGQAPDEQVRIWTPGCSTGEETYSLVICLLEYLGSAGLQPSIQIFGTDASERVVQTARLGTYPESIAEDVSPERLRHFFVRVEKGYQISKRVRDLCIFARQNLYSDPPFSHLDLISCRNVLIYFGRRLQKQVIPTFHYALRPNGCLLLGASETLREYPDLFRAADRRHRFFQKIPGANPAPPPAGERVPAAARPADRPSAPKPGARWTEAELQRAADRIVLALYGPAGLVVNDRMEILQSRGNTAPFLEMAPGASSLTLTGMLRDSIAAEVRNAVQKAIAENAPVRVDDLGVRELSQTGVSITVEVLPIQSPTARERCYLVLFVPSPRQSARATHPERPAAPLDTGDAIVAQLRKELDSTKLYLQSLVEEREIKNQDLTSANEEIQSANEELQSANEELETTKEELQSANEELQTVNDELQQRNSALVRTGDDLNNLLTSINIPVLMLSSKLEVRQFTPPMQRLINLRASDIGRPVNEISHNLKLDDLRPPVQEVLDTLATHEMEVQDREGRWYVLRVRPYRTLENKIEGAVLVLLDIDQLRRGQEQLRLARDFAVSVIESVQVPVAVLNLDLKVRVVNSVFRALAGRSAAELQVRPMPELAASLWGMTDFGEKLKRLRDDQSGACAFDMEHETPGPDPRFLCVRATRLPASPEAVLLLSVEDMTERRKGERLLASSADALGRTQHQLRALTASLFRSQEDERRRVARELHDDISQKLALLDMDMKDVEDSLGREPDCEALRSKVGSLRQRAGTLSEDVRRISHGLHPSILEDLGLPHALRALVEDFGRREHMLASFSSRNAPDELRPELSGTLYRIAQEALRNIAKHAGKTHVRVTLACEGDQIRLEVTDLGEGFDPEDGHRGLGLIGMAERARLVGGVFSVRSGLGKGTTVTVEAPLTAGPEK